MKNENNVIENMKNAIDYIKENVIVFKSYMSLEFENNEVFIYTDMKRIFPSEILQITDIFKDYGYVLNAVSTKNKEFKNCFVFEISIN
jgi:hypothetical protein